MGARSSLIGSTGVRISMISSSSSSENFSFSAFDMALTFGRSMNRADMYLLGGFGNSK